jgi:threonine dehydrogenase-like Zn-dependent dehydrogenase
MMRAAVLEDWHRVITKDVVDPVPDMGEALLKVSLAGVCGSDVHIFNGTNPIAKTPIVQGHEFVAEVVGFGGSAPDGIGVGDRVAVHPLVSCGSCSACTRGIPHVCEKLTVIGVNRDGAFAEFVTVPSRNLILLPPEMPDEVAVLTEPFAVGYHALHRCALVPGERVLIIGCGPIGLCAALSAAKLGARDVVVSEPMAKRRALGESLGVTTVDPSDENCLSEIKSMSLGDGYDVVIETSGVDAGIAFAIEAAAVQGRIASLGFPASGSARYGVTRGIVKELSFVGSRVYPFEEFRRTVTMLSTLNSENVIDFGKIVSSIQGMESLEEILLNASKEPELGKVLIRPGETARG